MKDDEDAMFPGGGHLGDEGVEEEEEEEQTSGSSSPLPVPIQVGGSLLWKALIVRVLYFVVC